MGLKEESPLSAKWHDLAKKLSFIFESQLVPFAFSPIFGDPFMVSPLLLKYEEGRLFFQKMPFMGGQIYEGIVLHGQTNDQVIRREKEFQKIHFPVT